MKKIRHGVCGSRSEHAVRLSSARSLSREPTKKTLFFRTCRGRFRSVPRNYPRFLFFFWRTSRTRRTRNGSGGFCIHVSLSFRCVSVLLCPRSVSDDFYPGANRLQQGVAGDKEEARGKFHRWRRFFFSPYSFCARISASLRRSSESARDRATSLPVCQQAATPRRAFSFFHVADMFARHAVVPVVTGGTD